MKSRLDVTMVKAQNRRLVFDAVVASAPTTRAEIAQQTHLSAGTVATILDELVRAGVVREVKETRKSVGPAVGRRPHRVEFLPKAARILSVDLASVTPSYSVIDLALSTESSCHFTAEPDESYELLLRRLLEDVRRMLATTEGDRSEQSRPIIGVGVSVPGPYRATDDRVFCKLIPELNAIALKVLFREYLTCPILIDHDVKLALSTEVKLIPHSEHKTILSLYLGEGVGSAISINGAVFGGAHEFAGEIGQMRIGDGDTFEDMVSWTSFLAKLGIPAALAKDTDDGKLNEQLLERYESGEQALVAQLNRVIRAVAVALANAICLLNPHAVIVSGRYALFGERFVADLQAATEARLIDDLKRDLVFLRSGYSGKAPLMGAASAVRASWLDRRFSYQGLPVATDVRSPATMEGRPNREGR